jgi:Xaa-Pro aminopeptidase
VSAAGPAARRERLRAELVAHHLDVLLVTDPRNVRYLTGFRGSNGQLLLAAAEAAGADRLVTDERYLARAASEAGDLEVACSREPGEVALTVARTTAGRRLGVEAEHLTWAQARALEDEAATSPTVEVVATEGWVEALRQVKDDAEVAALAAACELTTTALAWLLVSRVRPGVTERELARTLEQRFVELGAEGVAFPSIVAAGPNGASPHHEPTDRPIVAGELVTIDCGARVDGYHADCTRTVAVGAPPAPELIEVHDLVRRAQAAGRAAARVCATGGDVDAAAREVIEAAGHGDAFVHGTGHGVGLAIHELPAVAMGSGATLDADTVLTVEPGVYLPGLGGVRIEDTIVVTADASPRLLTDLPHELRVLPA